MINDPINKPFMGIFIIPTPKIPIEVIIGSEEQKLNEIRVQSKSFIWHQPSDNVCCKYIYFSERLL